MSIKMLTILQLIGIFAAYPVMTLLLPSLLLYRKVKQLRFSVRFLIYLVAGNFYLMNLVFLLQLLHISNRVTLLLFTVVPYLFAFFRVRQISLKKFGEDQFQNLRKLSGGQLGRKTFLRKNVLYLGKQIGHLCLSVLRRIQKNLPDCVLLLGLTILLLWIYGTNSLYTYGYCVSDLPVHNYWINYMGKNQIFVAGVYPFGFHCIIYYLHAVFGFDTYVLLRLFCVLQTYLIHMVLFAFIRACCKSRYAAYAGVGIYVASAMFHPDTYSRYYSSLPQEFGMLFLLPAIYFAFAFFQKKHSETENYKEKKTANWYLVAFSMSFSMTLAAHFYDTIIAGLFCIGIAVAFLFRFLRRAYFVPILTAGFIGILIAVLPMGIAYAAGTPLQGSLGWGMNIISGTEEADTSGLQEETETEAAADTELASETEVVQDQGTNTLQDTTGSDVGSGNEVEVRPFSDIAGEKAAAFAGKIETVSTKLAEGIYRSVTTYVTLGSNSLYDKMIFGGIGLLGILGIVFFLLRRTDYAARLLATAVFMVLLSVLEAAEAIGIPVLMDASRTSIFYAYMLPVVWSLCLDAVLYLLLGWLRRKWILQGASLLCLLVIGVMVVRQGNLKAPAQISGLESNAAVTCLTNIIHDNKDQTWTICSANDELRMGEDHGYHYETIEFLNRMEHAGANALIQIPTHYVYFFIEKIPLDYTEAYEGSGQSVSEQGAQMALPIQSGISMYKGESRWVVMSRMYYWAQAFREMYPNEMEVYYETDDFVCYRVEQNDYSLYNFAIDYGYNTADSQEE